MSEEGSDEDYSDWIEGAVPCQSLFSEKTLPSALETVSSDSEKYGFNVLEHAARLNLDYFGYVRLVNHIRKTRCTPEQAKNLSRSDSYLQDDALLKPVLEDDPLLQIDFDEAIAPLQKGKGVAADESERIQDLEDQIASLRLAFAKASRELLDGEAGPSQRRDDDTHYFRSYAANEIHESMLKDTVRTNAYRDFILNNEVLFKDKVVLDVGCGTGILSMFAAKAGARKVYAVDASQVAFQAMEHVKENGLDEQISVLHGKVEDIQLPEKVDFIVSEWMGYFLLYESMLDSVIYARDHFLKEGGLLVPSQCSMLLAGVNDARFDKERLDFWEDVYGFKMTAMQAELYEEAIIATVEPDSLITDVAPLKDFHLPSMAASDVDFSATFTLRSSRDGPVRMICVWFDAMFANDGRLLPTDLLFSHGGLLAGETAFTTSPQGQDTHWCQALFLLRKPIELKNGQELESTINVRKSEDNSRELVVEMVFKGHEDEAQTWCVR